MHISVWNCKVSGFEVKALISKSSIYIYEYRNFTKFNFIDSKGNNLVARNFILYESTEAKANKYEDGLFVSILFKKP